MLTATEMSRLIDRIYAAGETGEGWGDCLAAINDAVSGTGAHLFHYDPPPRSNIVVVHTRSDPAAVDAYVARFHRVDPWETRLPARTLASGSVIPGYTLLSHAEVRRTEYYADFGRAAGLTRSLFGVVKDDATGVRSAVSVNRSDSQAEFDDEAARFLSVLMPHVGRALQGRAHWAGAGLARAAVEALDALPCAVLLVDGESRVCFANSRASALLAGRDGIATDGGRLRGANPSVTRRLRDLCAEVAATRSDVPRHPGATLDLPRADAAMPLHALVAPTQVHGALSVTRRDVAAVIYITDPTAAPVADEMLLRESYGLTPAESRVAVLLAAGHGVDETAAELQYTRETVRWYVKQVLARAGCRTRAEFAARAATSIATLRTR